LLFTVIFGGDRGSRSKQATGSSRSLELPAIARLCKGTTQIADVLSHQVHSAIKQPLEALLEA